MLSVYVDGPYGIRAIVLGRFHFGTGQPARDGICGLSEWSCALCARRAALRVALRYHTRHATRSIHPSSSAVDTTTVHSINGGATCPPPHTMNRTSAPAATPVFLTSVLRRRAVVGGLCQDNRRVIIQYSPRSSCHSMHVGKKKKKTMLRSVARPLEMDLKRPVGRGG